MVVLDLPLVTAQHVRHLPGITTAISGGAVSGWETGGQLGGLLGGVAAIVGIVLTVISMNRKNRQQYAQEIEAAEARGELRGLRLAEDNRRDMEFWREYALGISRREGRQTPVPPSERDNSEEVGS